MPTIMEPAHRVVLQVHRQTRNCDVASLHRLCDVANRRDTKGRFYISNLNQSMVLDCKVKGPQTVTI